MLRIFQIANRVAFGDIPGDAFRDASTAVFRECLLSNRSIAAFSSRVYLWGGGERGYIPALQ